MSLVAEKKSARLLGLVASILIIMLGACAQSPTPTPDPERVERYTGLFR
jgi:hypothetical protein